MSSGALELKCRAKSFEIRCFRGWMPRSDCTCPVVCGMAEATRSLVEAMSTFVPQQTTLGSLWCPLGLGFRVHRKVEVCSGLGAARYRHVATDHAKTWQGRRGEQHGPKLRLLKIKRKRCVPAMPARKLHRRPL